MGRKQNIYAFEMLGTVLKAIANDTQKPISCTEEHFESLKTLIQREQHYNGWFTEDVIRNSFKEISFWLKMERLEQWLLPYSYTNQPQTVALILPGNLPLVGFHDFLCVLCSGHKALLKLSSEDARLLPAIVQILTSFEPQLKDRITIASGKLQGFDAVIATGSNNSMLHFKQYFANCPHLLRGHRTSIAVLNGTETPEELTALGQDIFQYYGRGCRNVTQLWIPENFELNRFFEAILPYAEVINHKKYGNNYDYNKAVHLMNQVPILDNNFVLLKESTDLYSPLSVLHYQRYNDHNEVLTHLEENQHQIQCIVGHNYLPFGSAQCPQLTDYADGIDTMQFLGNFA